MVSERTKLLNSTGVDAFRSTISIWPQSLTVIKG